MNGFWEKVEIAQTYIIECSPFQQENEETGPTEPKNFWKDLQKKTMSPKKTPQKVSYTFIFEKMFIFVILFQCCH